MQVVEIAPSDLVLSEELQRSGRTKQFEDRLRSSIENIGLAEPIKVAMTPLGKYLVVDGMMRVRAIRAIQEHNPSAFSTVPAYVTDYERRYEIRYQTDIYQDLLPSQLAHLVEHLHATEGIRKIDIARYIGVSPTTLRNYTGLWRLMQRGGLFESLVVLMDVGVFPCSNPFAWQRLTAEGLALVLQQLADEDETVDIWIDRTISAARQGHVRRYTTVEIELVTGALADAYYREDSDLRSVKQSLGTRRAVGKATAQQRNRQAAKANLDAVYKRSNSPVLSTAANSLREYLG